MKEPTNIKRIYVSSQRPPSRAAEHRRRLCQKPRLSLQPLSDDPRPQLAFGWPLFRKAVIHNVVALDAERALYDSGGLLTVAAIDRLLEQITHLPHSSSASRLTAGAAGFLIITHTSARPAQ